jgi:CBS domain-containing protein
LALHAQVPQDIPQLPDSAGQTAPSRSRQENDQLIGIVTDRDIVCKGLAHDGFDARRATARDVMT